ncbi:CRISPR-associated protein Cas6 [Haloarcula sp. CBA1115]|uniref:CRISPR system precrRNA processing endoribonuclease RAMP protein Cas6 n=1 Tax=unclassified Haloarcula TaxID=2624677 RepID=UPI0005955BAB|nr:MULTISPECIES: CRISPR system precrRNA processing endoribonuclease RAMP protein Cas6 [unclassified Haloarcula]AJF26804.1 CRISPR-associated protein Cas6 [Haloarcula sp. CBA1115]
MRQVELTLEPTEAFVVPSADGYQVYGALLGALDDVASDVSEHIHDTHMGSLHNSGLLGTFRGTDRKFHKRVDPSEKYQLSLGVTDPADQSVFEALADAFVFGGDSLELSEGQLRVRDFASSNTTHEELLETAAVTVDDLSETFEIKIQFRTLTCIEEADEITTMFPHRGTVFRSLLRRWNKTLPENAVDRCELGMTRKDFESNLIEKPDAYTYDTGSVLVNRGEDGSPILAQGFTGTCTYKFKDASEAVRTAVTALAQFGEYAGVGSCVARGCGAVEVEIQE